MVDCHKSCHYSSYNARDVAVIKTRDAQREPEHCNIKLFITKACRKP
jgi:hypothetical protein